MRVREAVFVGCGDHGRELFDTIAAYNALEPTWSVLGFVDDTPQHPNATIGDGPASAPARSC